MTKKFKTLSISLMIAFLLTAISCQVEEEAIQIDNNKLQYYTSKVNYKKLEENKILINKLSNIEVLDNNFVKNTTSKIVYFSQYDFYIDTDVSNYIESVDGSYHSYSFPIIYLTDSDTGFIKNLVLSFNSTKNDYDTYIITYQVNEEEKQKIENNIFVDLTGKTSINTLNNFDIDSLLRFVYIDPDTGEYSCWEEIYGTSISTGWDNQIIGYQQVDCFSGGGGTTGNGSGTPSGNYGDTGNNLGGSSGTGSGGGGNGSVVTSPIVAVNTSKEQIKRQNCFINSLSPSQQAFINDNNNSEIKEQVLAYLESQVSNFSAVCHQQSDMDFAEELIDFILNNETYAENLINHLNEENWSDESIQFVNYVIDVLENNPAASPLIGADCRSFEFAQPPGATKKGCAVINFNHTFYTAGIFPSGSPYFGEIDSVVPIAFFTMPSWMTNGRAANLTAKAVTFAIKATDLYYAANPTVSEVVLGQYFSNRLTYFLNAVGGTVSTSTPPFTIPSPAPYITSLIGLSNPYDCE